MYCIYACTCTCAYTHYGYYTEMVVELVKAKGDRKKGCACTCSVYCPHTLCMCIHIFCTVVCHTYYTYKFIRLAASMHCVFMLYCMDDVCHTTHVCHHTVWRLCTDGSSRLG